LTTVIITLPGDQAVFIQLTSPFFSMIAFSSGGSGSNENCLAPTCRVPLSKSISTLSPCL